MTDDLKGLRASYLYPLAHLCHVHGQEVSRLTLTDFANYIDNIDEHLKPRS